MIDGWAMQARCPHLKAELAHFGVVDGTTLTCRMHGWQWDLDHGRAASPRGATSWRRHAVDEPAEGTAVCIEGSAAPGDGEDESVHVPDGDAATELDADDVSDFAMVTDLADADDVARRGAGPAPRAGRAARRPCCRARGGRCAWATAASCWEAARTSW